MMESQRPPQYHVEINPHQQTISTFRDGLPEPLRHVFVASSGPETLQNTAHVLAWFAVRGAGEHEYKGRDVAEAANLGSWQSAGATVRNLGRYIPEEAISFYKNGSKTFANIAEMSVASTVPTPQDAEKLSENYKKAGVEREIRKAAEKKAAEEAVAARRQAAETSLLESDLQKLDLNPFDHADVSVSGSLYRIQFDSPQAKLLVRMYGVLAARKEVATDYTGQRMLALEAWRSMPINERLAFTANTDETPVNMPSSFIYGAAHDLFETVLTQKYASGVEQKEGQDEYGIRCSVLDGSDIRISLKMRPAEWGNEEVITIDTDAAIAKVRSRFVAKEADTTAVPDKAHKPIAIDDNMQQLLSSLVAPSQPLLSARQAVEVLDTIMAGPGVREALTVMAENGRLPKADVEEILERLHRAVRFVLGSGYESAVQARTIAATTQTTKNVSRHATQVSGRIPDTTFRHYTDQDRDALDKTEE